MENLIATFKTIDLQHLNTKSEEFKNKYKDLLEQDGKRFLVYSGAWDQFPLALSYEEYDSYIEALRNAWLEDGESWETIERWENEMDCTGIKF